MPGEDKDRQGGGHEGIDDAFAKIVEGLDISLPDVDLPDTPDAVAPSRPADGGPAEIALLLPGVDSDEAMAAVCRLAGIEAVCVPSDIGTIVSLADAGQAAAQQAATAFSGMLRTVPVVLLRRGPSEDPADSDVQAARYLGGTQQDRLAPGLLLAQAPDVIEGLVLGSLDPKEVPGAIESRDLTRMKATKILARLLRGFGNPGRRDG